MNIVTTKHQTHQVDQMTKGQTLGKVGVIMIFSFVGLIFATTLVAVRAAINNEIVHITQTNNQLIAEANYEDLGNSSLRWQWFSVPTGTG
ncbi:MAG: hypothetical protein OXF30_00245, partial [Candidatus Saccharibacteria bacterium]|nr:hypothetical protein [Candidatus Saccharibacteria bacterium]